MILNRQESDSGGGLPKEASDEKLPSIEEPVEAFKVVEQEISAFEIGDDYDVIDVKQQQEPENKVARRLFTADKDIDDDEEEDKEDNKNGIAQESQLHSVKQDD